MHSRTPKAQVHAAEGMLERASLLLFIYPVCPLLKCLNPPRRSYRDETTTLSDIGASSSHLRGRSLSLSLAAELQCTIDYYAQAGFYRHVYDAANSAVAGGRIARNGEAEAVLCFWRAFALASEGTNVDQAIR